MGGIFSRTKNEEKFIKKAAIGNKFKIGKYITYGLLCAATAFLTVFSFGTILLIDGGITISYLIVSLSMTVYDKITQKYLENISPIKKRDFNEKIYEFYEKIINPFVQTIEILIKDFIEKENILDKTNKKFDDNKNKFIDESKLLKNKFNILLIGPSGSGKSTLINEFLKLDDNKKAKEGKGDSQTLGFYKYTTDGSKYCLIDSQGFDYTKSIDDFAKMMKTKVKEYNQKAYQFIDMIYYCTNNMNRFQIQEYKLICKLKELFDLENIPLIIVFTQCYFQSDFEEMQKFIHEKYNKDNFKCMRVIARKKEDKEAYGLEELKNETDKILNNFKENAYAGKFIANISKVLYKDYSDSFISSFIKGYIKQDKEESILELFFKIFNMYRFEKKELSNDYLNRIENIKHLLIEKYETNLNNLTDIVIDLHAESSIIEEFKLDKFNDLTKENITEKERLKKNLTDNEFNIFKYDIDVIVFPCLLDILKINLIKCFNGHIMDSLEPKIKELMAKD